jgi:hypothetical protein
MCVSIRADLESNLRKGRYVDEKSAQNPAMGANVSAEEY